MNSSELSSEENMNPKLTNIFIYYAIGITVFFWLLRLIAVLGPNPSAPTLEDVDYRTLHDLLTHGVFEYYDHASIGGFYAIYLYYWTFIFYPIFILPIDIGFIVWDILRVIATIYVAKNMYKITNREGDLLVFLILACLGFTADAFLNNTNWLITLLLLISYIQLKEDRKWLAGILFAIAMYKINVFVFPIMLLFGSRIKPKDLVYFIAPFLLLCLPYFIFPDYFMKLFRNWTDIEGANLNDFILPLQIYLITWQAFQTGQMMFFGLNTLVFLAGIEDEKWHNRYRIVIPIILIILNITFPMVLWQITG